MARAIASTLALILTLALGSAAFAAPPAMFRGDPALTGVYDAPPPRRLKGVRFSFASGAPIRGTPVLSGGVLYFGNSDRAFFAIDAKTGAERWRIRTSGAVTSSPSLVDGVAYFTTRDGKLYAVSAADGRVRWRFAFGADLGDHNYWDFYTSSPTPVGGALYVGSGDGKLYAIDRKSGRPLWSTDLGARVRSTPAVSGDLVVVGTMAGKLEALDLKTGARRWTFATEGASRTFAFKHNDTTSIMASPAIRDGVVVIGGRDGQIYGVDLKTGAQKWKTTHDGGSWILSAAVEPGRAYIGSGSAYIVQAADLNSGAEAWRFKVSSAVFAPVVLAGDVVLFDDLSGKLYAADKATGAELWRFSMKDMAYASPVVGDGAVFAASDAGVLWALDVGADAPTRPPVKRLVYFEGAKSPNALVWFLNDVDTAIFNDFKAAGYTPVDAEGLRAAMENQIAGKERSLVVFADDRYPAAIAEPRTDQALIRRYLEHGGRVAFLGGNPMGFITDPKTGEVTALDNPGAAAIVGVRLPAPDAESGYHVSEPTAEGTAWGLRGFLVSGGAILPDASVTVLARNEFGMATWWARHYGGPDGGDLIQLYPSRVAPGDLSAFRNVIEHGLR